MRLSRHQKRHTHIVRKFVNWDIDIMFLVTLTLVRLTFTGDCNIQSGMSLLFERVKHLFLFVMLLTLLDWLVKLQVFIITSLNQTEDAAVRYNRNRYPDPSPQLCCIDMYLCDVSDGFCFLFLCF